MRPEDMQWGVPTELSSLAIYAEQAGEWLKAANAWQAAAFEAAEMGLPTIAKIYDVFAINAMKRLA